MNRILSAFILSFVPSIVIAQPLPPISLPIEVLGTTSASEDVFFTLNSGDVSSGTFTFQTQISGLEYESEGSITINDSFVTLLTNASVSVAARQAAFGGIGGGYSTLKISFPVPLSALQSGTNKVTFNFLGTDGFVSGFRVLKFNIVKNGTNLIPTIAFVEDNPDLWTGPYTDSTSIADGAALWSGASLYKSPLETTTSIRAKCSDCHTRDGYDLKYFNYSNHSIIERSKFHGLTQLQGEKIASYIRSLNYPSPGRPWNPPYQPGPGIDAKPIDEWAAGAGIDAVLDNDIDTYSYLFPSGIPHQFDPTSIINVREIPVSLQLLPWNSWLPRIYPADYWGDSFANGPLYGCYTTYRDNPYFSLGTIFSVYWFDEYFSCIAIKWSEAFVSPGNLLQQVPAYQNRVRRDDLALYSIAQWRTVKMWESMRENEMEGLGYVMRDNNYFRFPGNVSSALTLNNPRSWIDSSVFRTAPHMNNVNQSGDNGVRTGGKMNWDYFSLAWYYLQLVLTDNHRTGDGPVHWAYMNAFTGVRSGQYRFGALRAISLHKQMEAYYNNYDPATMSASYAWGIEPRMNYWTKGYNPAVADIFDETPDTIYKPMVASWFRAYFERTQDFTLSQWQQAFATSFHYNVPSNQAGTVGPHADSQYWHQQWYWTLRDLAEEEILEPSEINNAIDFAKLLWPAVASEFESLRQ